MQLESPRPLLTVIVLAGDRNPEHSLLKYTGVCCKALIEIDHVPMVLRVVRALDQAEQVGKIILSGPKRQQLNLRPEISSLVDTGKVCWFEPESSPSTSAYRVMQTLPPATAVLITTADLPFLDAAIVNSFCAQSLAQDVDVTVGLAPYEFVKQAFPHMKKTVLRFSDGDYCGCNLFAVTTEAGRHVADFWRQVESQRKKPLRIIRLLGWRLVIAYLFGFLSLENALAALSRKMGLRVGAVILRYPNAAVDIDSVSDYVMVEQKIAENSVGNI